LEKERDIKKGKLIVIAARDAAAQAKSTDIYADLLYAWRKLSLFAGENAKQNRKQDGKPENV
jgi:hypothetical protein